MRFSEIVHSFSFRLAGLSALGLIALSVVASIAIYDILHQDRHDLAQAEVKTALSVVADYDMRSQNGEFSQEEAKRRAIAILRVMRYADNEYFFVTNLEAQLLLDPARPEWEGDNVGLKKDVEGFETFQSFIDKAKAGGGFTHYHFPRWGSEKPECKDIYSTLYAPWGWVVNTGIYTVEIDAKFWWVMRTFALVAGGVFLGVSILAYFASKQLTDAMEGKRRAEHEAMRAAKLASIGQMAAGVAHEINTPAQYVGDNLHFLAEELTALKKGGSCGHAQELLDAVADAQDGVARITKIVSSMKEFARPGITEMVNADINHALDSTLTVTQHAWKGVAEIECRFASGLPTILCHASDVNQVFLNLILNAAEAIKGSGRSLPGRILIETFESDGDVVVRISDNGPGIPQELRERIFDPFFTTKPVGQGIGQGLAVSRDVIEIKHGGRIEVGGKEGEGAVFSVHLPGRVCYLHDPRVA